MQKKKEWIWQHKEYPRFKYSIDILLPKIRQISKNIGQVKALLSLIDENTQNSIKIDLFASEIISTSAIEGENLQRESVRASIRKRLDFSFDSKEDCSTYHTDSLANILIDTIQNNTPLDLERVHKWHIALLAHTPSRFTKIKLGVFRDYDDMQIVSGVIGKEKVHYVGLPANKIAQDINLFLDYVNTNNDDVYIKSAIAHLWFVTIHPYDDGNGRMARIINDYILSKDFEMEYKYFGISSSIAKDRKNYYEKLEASQNLIDNPNLDCTAWILWYLDKLNDSLIATLNIVEKVMNKTRFWDKIRNITLNQRQLKVLNKLLEYNSGEFQGGLTTKKYISMTKTSISSAKRDIQELVNLGYLKQSEGMNGRNVRYEIML